MARNNLPTKYKLICTCGKPFEASYLHAKYCSDECRKKGRSIQTPERDREFTELTAMLCQKWRKEGMSVKAIADVLKRSPDSVRKALKVKLPRYQQAIVDEVGND